MSSSGAHPSSAFLFPELFEALCVFNLIPGTFWFDYVCRRFDVDNDGTVERDELAQGLKAIGEKVSETGE
jgi:hypothetical protein